MIVFLRLLIVANSALLAYYFFAWAIVTVFILTVWYYVWREKAINSTTIDRDNIEQISQNLKTKAEGQPVKINPLITKKDRFLSFALLTCSGIILSVISQFVLQVLGLDVSMPYVPERTNVGLAGLLLLVFAVSFTVYVNKVA